MKTVKTAVAALLIAGGAIGAFAFTKANTENVNNKKTDLYWFDAVNHEYIGHGDVSITGCPNTGSKECAYGYSQLDENDQPVGTATIVRKP